MRNYKKTRKTVLRTILKVFCLMLSGCGCGENYHRVDYAYPFFYDSTTVGALRVEYDENVTQGVSQPESKYSDISLWVDFYDITSDKVVKSICLEENPGGVSIYPAVFSAPWLLYRNKNSNSGNMVMMNVETGEKWLVYKNPAIKLGISTGGNYAILDGRIYKREDGSFISESFPLQIVCFDEDSMVVLVYYENKLLKSSLNGKSVDTLEIPDQIDPIRMVASGRFAIVNIPGISVTGEDYIANGLVTLQDLMAGDFSTEPLSVPKYNSEFCPEKDLWVAGNGSISLGRIHGSTNDEVYILEASQQRK